MLGLFKPNHHSILGIDISSTSVKVIEISGKDEHRCVEGYGIEMLPSDVVDGHTIKDTNALANCIKQLVARHQLHSKWVAVAVPDSAVITKVLQINTGLNDSEIEEIILMEADKYIPYPIEEINLDFQVLGPSVKNMSMLDVLIVASRSENVSGRVEAITKAGLQAKIVDVESFAVERVVQLVSKELPAQGKDKTIAVFDVGSIFANLFVMHGMKIIFTREEEFGSKQLLDELVSHYGITYAEQVQMNTQEKMPSDYEEKVLTPFKDTILLHIKRSLQFFFSTSHHEFVDHILLSGGVAKIPNLADFIQEKTNVPTTLINPVNHMLLSKKASATGIINDAPLLMLACGLALRKVE